MKNYTVYHLHSDLSSGVTNIDSVTKYKQYIAKAKECDMTALAFSEHGSVFEWWHKKQDVEKAGMKYIHAIEAYVTSTLSEKNRDNYHCVLIAKNYEGFKEINTLSSKSFNREDGHFYYNPRITIDELINTSDNIIVTTACLGGILHNGKDGIKKKFLRFLIDNKHRCFLEIQHHMEPDQIKYNQYLYELHNEYDIPLIAGTDTHALNDEHLEARGVLQKSKNVHFENEDAWDLTFKTYDELIDAYQKQQSLPEAVYLEAIENTNIMADMVEEFSIDRNPKYPKLYDDSEKVFNQKILEGIKWRGIDKLPNKEEYLTRIKEEIATYKHNDAIDFMLLEEDYKTAMRKKNIYPGYSRGSVSGSVIAYLLGITEIDSIKHNLNFQRFMNTERVSLADIDSDWYDAENSSLYKSDKEEVKRYLHNKKELYCSEIITFNTIKLKGSIRDIGRGLGYDLKEISEIAKNVEDNEDYYRKQYPDIFKYVDIVQGVIVSVGNHPAGTVVSPFPVDEWFGTFTTTSCKYPVSQINMKELDDLNFVKLDVLGLDTMGLINKTCELIGIERLTPNNTPLDENVFKSIRDDTTCIFQWESDSAAAYLKKLLSDEVVEKIKSQNPDFSYMDLLSIGNGAIRPAGASYRNELANGDFRDCGHEALNKMMASTLGFMVFQEQIIQFLHEFCGYTMGKADIVRRGFAKKTGTDKFIPEIKSGFTEAMIDQYDVTAEDADKIIVDFIQVIEDASDYLFSLNHSDPYSWIGYICGYLRYHYPYEFLTTAFNVFEDNEEKTLKITEYAKKQGIKIESIKFRYSRPEYTCSKETGSIYKGMKSIKYLNKKISLELYRLRDRQFQDFYDLLNILNTETSVNSRQLDILIKLDFFSEFGNPNQLLYQVELYNKYYSRKQLKKDELTTDEIAAVLMCEYTETDKLYKVANTMEIIRQLDNSSKIKTSICDRIQYESEHLGYIGIVIPKLPADLAYITDINDKYKNRIVTLYRLNSGEVERVKVKGATFERNPLEVGQVIKTIDASMERRWRKKADGGFEQIDEYETILKKWSEVK